MVFTRPLISKSSSSCTNLLTTVPSAQITVDITITFMFHSFFKFPNKVQVLIFILPFFQFYTVFNRDSKGHNLSKFFFITIIKYGSLAEIRWAVCVSKSQGSLCVSFSRTNSEFSCTIRSMIIFNFLARFLVEHLAFFVLSSLILFLC